MPSCVLVVADPDRIAELVAALSAPLPSSHAPGLCDLLISSGGDDTIDLFQARRPEVVVVTATLVTGDSRSLIETLRAALPRGEVAVVVVGDDASGPIRTALDAIDLDPDRFVQRPLSAETLRFSVAAGIDAVTVTRGAVAMMIAARGTPPPSPAVELDGEVSEDVAASGRAVSDTRVAIPSPIDDGTSASTRAALRARWTAIADSIGGADESLGPDASGDVDSEPGPVIIHPRSPRPPTDEMTPPPSWRDEPAAPALDDRSSPWHSEPVAAAVETSALPQAAWRADPPVPRAWNDSEPSAPLREPTLIIPDSPAPGELIATPFELSQPHNTQTTERTPVTTVGPPATIGLADADAAALGALETSATATSGTMDAAAATAAAPAATLPAAPGSDGAIAASPASGSMTAPTRRVTTSNYPVVSGNVERSARTTAPPTSPDGDTPTQPRTRSASAPPNPIPPARATTQDIWPISRPPARAMVSDADATADLEPVVARANTIELSSMLSPEDRARYLAEVEPHDSVVVAERGPDEHWSKPILLTELPDRDSRRDLRAAAVRASRAAIDELGLDDFDDDDDLLDDAPAALQDLAPPRPRRTRPSDLNLVPPRVKTVVPIQPERPVDERPGGRDFARQLRAKMSQMAQRLFQGAEAAQSRPDDLTPRHDHHTEIDLASLGDEIALGGGVTEIEARHAARLGDAVHATSPGSWDTHVRERGLADQGDLTRGMSDAAMLLARMFAHASTGRIAFRRPEADVEKIVYFDQGRPVFASSNEPGDRMGELLVREGKITAAQYERCQVHVAESGRRMGEILVDFGYLKRRELLPAVRRHVEDILYSLFGWSAGRYHVVIDPTPCAERIRLSRHPASLVLEGIRRKLDRTTLERLVGPASTVIEVPDRDKLGGVVNLADLAAEERAALVAFDGQADLSQVARAAMIDVADLLPLAWGLCALGLASARRTDTEVPDESTALVGETDLAIDRERVRSRWQLVTEADYFALLGVRRDATGFEIRRAYQAARRDFAADCFPNDLRRELAQELEDIAHVLDEAFRVLRDDRLRLTYLTNLVE